jgi:hypothetical protein
MGTKITIETDDPLVVARVAQALSVGDLPGGAIIKAPKPPKAETAAQAPLTGVGTTLTPASPLAPSTAATTAAPPAAEDPYALLSKAMGAHAQTPGKSAQTLAGIMAKYTDPAQAKPQPDGSTKPSVNRMHVPPGQIAACIAELNLR